MDSSGALEDGRNTLGGWYGCFGVAEVLFWCFGGAVSARGECQ